ncbi:MAG: hypothetical protein J0I09_07490 [Sphingobacteriia bacterium]|nr:hypothetical protein [Sphingobacteriia bacterium]
MNPIEALNNHVKENCLPCYVNALIIEFEELPEEKKEEFCYYEKDKHFILYCNKCEVYKLIPE